MRLELSLIHIYQYLEYDSTDSDWNGQGYGKLSFFSNYDRSGTTYYLKVRSFKLNGTTKIYGPWSSIKTVSVGNYRVASSAKAKYSYKFYFLDTAGIGLYGGVSKAVYIQTDNPDPNSIQPVSYTHLAVGTQATVNFSEDSSLDWPVAGNVLLDYSMDGSIFFPTLKVYKYNPALIIGADVGSPVAAAAKGIVDSVKVDEETGTTVSMNIGNGYEPVSYTHLCSTHRRDLRHFLWTYSSSGRSHPVHGP